MLIKFRIDHFFLFLAKYAMKTQIMSTKIKKENVKANKLFKDFF